MQAPAGYTGTEMLATGLLAFGAGMALGALINEDDDDWDCGWSDGGGGSVHYNNNVYVSNSPVPPRGNYPARPPAANRPGGIGGPGAAGRPGGVGGPGAVGRPGESGELAVSGVPGELAEQAAPGVRGASAGLGELAGILVLTLSAVRVLPTGWQDHLLGHTIHQPPGRTRAAIRT